MTGGWIALGRTADGARAIAVERRHIRTSATGPDEAAALAALDIGSARIIRIGDGTPDRLPAPVLPRAGKGLPGFIQDRPADVIGGWTRLWIAGFLARHPDWDGVIRATDGGVSHWIRISADEAVSSQSFLTPRLIALLGGAAEPDPGAIENSLSRPERLAAHLRVAEVTGEAGDVSGHLIGAELAAARPYWLGQRVAVLETLPSPFTEALAVQGVPCDACDPETLLADGLPALAKALKIDG